jgi:hypothetical protein
MQLLGSSALRRFGLSRRWLVIAASSVVALMVAGAVRASSATTVVVSPAVSPLASCTSLDGGLAGNTVNSEVEPWIVANPKNAQNLVVAWQQDRWGVPNEGGAHGFGNAYSANGGGAWTQSPTIPFDTCSGGTAAGNGNYDRASDVWVSAGPDGTLYESALAFNWFAAQNAVTVSKSTDGGATWSTPVGVDVLNRSSFTHGDDKESITADPYHAGTVYVVWDRYSSQKPAYSDGNGQNSSKGPAYFSRSTDGGLTWSDPQAIYARDNGTIGNQIVVLPDGTLADFFTNYVATNTKSGVTWTASLDEVQSKDQGKTWSGKAIVVSPMSFNSSVDPNGNFYVRDGAGLFDVAVDSTNSRLYAVWQDDTAAGGNGHEHVVLSASTDGGLTWSAPQLVSRGPANVDAFTPSVDVNSNGVVAVTYYDFRNNVTTPGGPFTATDYWADLYSSSGSALTFNSEVRLTASSFNAALAPDAGGVMLGDYEGLTHAANTFYAAFETTNTTAGNPTDIDVATINP